MQCKQREKSGPVIKYPHTRSPNGSSSSLRWSEACVQGASEIDLLVIGHLLKLSDKGYIYNVIQLMMIFADLSPVSSTPVKALGEVNSFAIACDFPLSIFTDLTTSMRHYHGSVLFLSLIDSSCRSFKTYFMQARSNTKTCLRILSELKGSLSPGSLQFRNFSHTAVF